MEMDSSRRRRLLLMTLGVVLALIAGGAAFMLGQAPRPPADAVVPMDNVVVALRNIPARWELTAEDVAVRQVPTSAVLPQAIKELDGAVGQLTGVPIFEGQQLTPNLLIGSLQDPLGIIPLDEEEITDESEYWRAVSVSVPRNRAVAGQLKDGDRVDLLVTVSLAAPLQPVLDENGNLTWQAVENALPVVNPETGELEGVVGGPSTKLTIPDLQILRAAPDEGLYILRVNLHQAEQINHIIQTAPDSFSMVLRPGQDTRPIDTSEYGETTDSVIMQYVYPVPLLVDLEELLGFPITPIEGLPSPPPAPEPSPEEPEEPEEP